MLRAFYDGSGKGKGRNSEAEFLTLAGIAAYDNLWADLEAQYRFVIDLDNRAVGDDLVVIVFDNGEEFEQRIRRIWDAVKKDESLLPPNRWVESVVTIMTLPSNDAPGLQAADVLAWNCNRHYCSGDRDDGFNAVWKNWPNEQVYYDYERVVAEYSTGVWVPPVRGATQP